MPDRSVLTSWLALAAVWAAAAVVIDPRGDFPLNDDWAYGRVVESLHVLGRLQLPAEVAVSLLAHSLWGLLFTKLFGFSFTVLRLSTWLVALVGLVFSFELLRAFRIDRTTTWIATLCVAFNPLFLSLSFTYMSDVFFFTTCVGALLFFVTFLASPAPRHLWLAGLLSLLAVFTRDVGLVVPLALAGAVWLDRASTRRQRAMSLLPVSLCALALTAYLVWLSATDRLPFAYGLHARRLGDIGWSPLVTTVLRSGRAMLGYVGLLLLPVLVPVAMRRARELAPGPRVRWAVLGSAVAVGLLAWTVAHRSLMPFADNIIGRATIGPVVLPYASAFLRSPGLVFWGVVTCGAILGAALLTVTLLDALARLRRRDVAATTVALVAALYAAGLLLTWIVDRYFLLLLPLCAVLIGRLAPRAAAAPRRWPLVASAALLAAMTVLSVAGTHDYLAWNRARWELARAFFAQEPPSRLDGGLEIDAWYAYPLDRPFVRDRSWWWMARKPYVITLGERPGFHVVARGPANTWLRFGDGFVYILGRD